MRFWSALFALLVVPSLMGCADEHSHQSGELHDPSGFFSERELVEIGTLSPKETPSPEDPTNAVADEPAAAHLGQFLFFDTRLSADGAQSCATCHQPDHGFADPDPLSTAVGTTGRHSPSVINSAFYHWYFWDGRADTLWAQALKPLEDPNEQATTRLQVAHLIVGDDDLRDAYEQIFSELPDLSDAQRFPAEGRPVPDDPDHPHHQAWSAMSEQDQQAVNRIFANVGKAIAAYEMKLTSFDSPFDTYVEGLRSGDSAKLSALTSSQKRGLKLFIGKANCVDCHNGPVMSDMEFHNLGLRPRSWLDEADLGRYEGVEIVKNDLFNAAGDFSDDPDASKAQQLEFTPRREEQKGAFKTPTLRNVTLNPPYMHGGHFDSLEEVIQFYSELDEEPAVGTVDSSLERLELSEQEVADLVAFLEALEGHSFASELTRQPDSPRFE